MTVCRRLWLVCSSDQLFLSVTRNQRALSVSQPVSLLRLLLRARCQPGLGSHIIIRGKAFDPQLTPVVTWSKLITNSAIVVSNLFITIVLTNGGFTCPWYLMTGIIFTGSWIRISNMLLFLTFLARILFYVESQYSRLSRLLYLQVFKLLYYTLFFIISINCS